ncbi:hypothetical protein TIFTF001_040177 [Ficus carica]|uniref:Uncharacterized protein n=1 Tax=Ficus carica TaxID=3494 RepID=A0AA87YSR4_FICCA|nr:hypothetical protein TIFTF001_040172 [Ficus carica]GMN22083.1 hypothetical protein TIFTF001_040177 [Ficus carica]
MKRVAQVLEDVAEGWLEEHKRKRSSYVNGDHENDLMGIMLSVLDQYEEIRSTYGSDRTNKGTCLDSES